MADVIRILVALDEHADRELVEKAIAGDFLLRIVGYAEHDDDWSDFLQRPGDVILVACGSEDESAAQMVERAVGHRTGRPVVVLSEGSPNGFLRQAFDAGADDVIALPQAPGELAFTLQKVIARRKGVAVPGQST